MELSNPDRGIVVLDGEGAICLAGGGWEGRDKARILLESELLGRVTALAVRHRECVSCCRLSIPLVKWGIQGLKVDPMTDIQVVDPILSLKKLSYLQTRGYLVDGMSLDDFGLMFVEGSPNREGGEIELIPGGRDTPVTEDSLDNYLDLCAKARLVGDGDRLTAFRRGWNAELSPKACRLLKRGMTPHECQLLISGAEEIQVDEMRRWTEYEDRSVEGSLQPAGLPGGDSDSADSSDAGWFWDNIESFSSKEKETR